MLQQRPPLFGPEKPPHEKKKMYHYYCNKIYKAHSIHNLFRQCDNVSYCGLFNSFFGWARWFDLPIQMGLRWHQRVGVWICSDAMHDMRGTTCLEMQCCMDWGQPKTWIEKFSRPGLAKIATAICASASLWLGQRLLWWHIVSRWKRKQAAFHLCNISREWLPPVISRPICMLPCVQNTVVMFGLFIGL